jgi:hypothetical protein
MPYGCTPDPKARFGVRKVRDGRGGYAIVNRRSGEVVGHSETYCAAAPSAQSRGTAVRAARGESR